MAKKVYYGYCSSGLLDSNIYAYEVTVPDLELMTGELTEPFEEGDLLAVYFGIANNYSDCKIVISNGDSQQESSISSDEGRFIKSYSVVAPDPQAWKAGEVVVFAYVANSGVAEPRDNSFYWMMLKGAPATTDSYGVTKLFDTNNVATWLADDTPTGDVAMKPDLLKKVLETVTSDVSWTQEASGTLKLGILTVDDTEYEVYTPEIIFPTIPTKTSDLINDASDPTKENNTAKGSFYITNAPGAIYFADGEGIQFDTPEDPTNPFMLVNDNGNTVLTGPLVEIIADSGTLSRVIISPKLSVEGNIASSGDIDTDGDITADGNVTGNAVISVNDITEGDKLLREKYSPLLTTTAYRVSAEISAKGSTNNQSSDFVAADYPNSEIGEWIPIGVIGWNFNYTSSSPDHWDSAYCTIWEAYIGNGSTTQIPYALKWAMFNHRAQTVYVTCDFTILWKKVIEPLTT